MSSPFPVPSERPELIAFDFDGVLTDNRVWIGEDGTESVACNRADGLGFRMLREAGIPCVVLSTERNPVVTRRCEKLGIECRQGLKDKKTALSDICARLSIEPRAAWYVGNDLNDLAAMRAAGAALCPADAHHAVRAASRFVLAIPGGGGVVRAIAEDILGLTYQDEA